MYWYIVTPKKIGKWSLVSPLFKIKAWPNGRSFNLLTRISSCQNIQKNKTFRWLSWASFFIPSASFSIKRASSVLYLSSSRYFSKVTSKSSDMAWDFAHWPSLIPKKDGKTIWYDRYGQVLYSKMDGQDFKITKTFSFGWFWWGNLLNIVWDKSDCRTGLFINLACNFTVDVGKRDGIRLSQSPTGRRQRFVLAEAKELKLLSGDWCCSSVTVPHEC